MIIMWIMLKAVFVALVACMVVSFVDYLSKRGR